MTVTILSKDFGDTQVKFAPQCEVKLMLEDLINKWIKKNLGLEKC